MSHENKQGESAAVHDGVDEAVWELLRAIMVAAHKGDPATVVSLFHDYEAAMSDDQRLAASAYTAYILRFLVVEPLQRRPTAQDLRELAERTYPGYSKIIREPVDALEDTLRAAFLMPRAESSLAGARLFISAVAASGVLLNEPGADLAMMRPRIARWRARDAGANPV
jgi:hypothetical protein